MHLCCKVDGVWLFNLFVPVCPKHTRDIPASIWHIAYQIFSKKTMHIKSYILMVQHFTVHPQCMLPSAVVFALWKVLKKMKLIKWGFLQCADGNLHACGTKLNVLALWNGAVAFVVVNVDLLSASIFSEIEVIQWNPEEMAVGTNAPATLASTLRFGQFWLSVAGRVVSDMSVWQHPIGGDWDWCSLDELVLECLARSHCRVFVYLCSFEIEIHPVSTWLQSVLLATYPDVTENCLKNHTSLAGQRLLKDLWHGCSMCRIKTKRGWVSQKKLILVPGCLLIKIIQVHHVRVQSRV